MIKAIPTTYKGYQFRSRLEARWAAMFDLLEWPWLYEPFDLDGYIPDFVLNFPYKPVLVEVKPEIDFENLDQYCNKIEASGWDKDYLVLGAGPMLPGTLWNVFGLITETGADDFIEGQICTWKSQAILIKCTCCNHYSVIHADGWWVCRYCGGYSGDGHIEWVNHEDSMVLWGTAHSRTQYHSRHTTPAKQDKIRIEPIGPVSLTRLAYKACPKCGAIPHMCINLSSATFDRWLACPLCKFEGEHDDSFIGAFGAWDRTCARV